MKKPRLERLEPLAYAALRMVAGSMFAVHGLQKIFGWAAAHAQPAIGSQLWVGGLIEISSGLLIALGLFTRCAAFVASGMMAVAYFQFHWKLQLGGHMWLPAVNHGELAVLYCFTFFFISTHGAETASIDALRRK